MHNSTAQRDDPLRGIILILLSVMFFSLSEAVSKVMSVSMAPVQIAWFRYVVCAAIFVTIALFSGPVLALRSARPGLQILRGVSGIGAAVLFIMALSHLPMAEATAISFVAPLLVTALSISILGEVVDLRRWLAILTGLIGVIIVIRPGTSTFQLASLLPLLSAASWATQLIITRKIGNSDDVLVSVIYAALVGLVATSCLVPFVWTRPASWLIVLGVINGLCTTVAQWLVVLALRQERASVLVPFQYSSLLWSVLLGYLLFANIPDIWTLVGAAVIIASGLSTLERRRS